VLADAQPEDAGSCQTTLKPSLERLR